MNNINAMGFLVTSYLHTHTFNGPFSGTTQVGRYQKGKTNLDFTEARDSERQWHQLGHMQVCTLLQTDNHASTPPLSFFTGWMPFLSPNQQRQSTEGKISYLLAEFKRTSPATPVLAVRISLSIWYFNLRSIGLIFSNTFTTAFCYMNNISSDVFILFANLNSREKFTFQKPIIADEVLKQYRMMLKFELIQYMLSTTQLVSTDGTIQTDWK